MAQSRVDILLQIQSDFRGLRATQVALVDLNRKLMSFRQTLMTGFNLRIGARIAEGLGQIPKAFAGAVREGVRFREMLEASESAFTNLLGSADRARDRMQQVVEFARVASVDLSGAMASAQKLESVTGGGFAGGQELLLIADAAAATGRSFDETSHAVGRLFQRLRDGVALGRALRELQEMNLVTSLQVGKYGVGGANVEFCSVGWQLGGVVGRGLTIACPTPCRRWGVVLARSWGRIDWVGD